MPKISVIVPVYNCEKYLEKCLDSLINQTFEDIEILCVDDGSTDNSYKILEAYSQKDIRVKVFQQENGGVASARNLALQKATGDWLAFCDSDDTVPLNAYKDLYNATKSVDIVIGDFYEIDDYGSEALITKQGRYKSEFFYAMFKIPSIWTKLIKRKIVIENNIQFQNVVVGEDVIFLAEIVALQPSYKEIMKPVYYHWYHNLSGDFSLTHKYNYDFFAAHMYCRDELLRICWKEKKIIEAYYYVYNDMLSYPFEYLFRIQDFNEKEKAFELFKKHLKQYDWTNEQERFNCLLGMPYEVFMKSSALQFFSTTNVLDPAEAVLKRYEAGMLGFRHILKYSRAWLNYKLKRFQVERKKCYKV